MLSILSKSTASSSTYINPAATLAKAKNSTRFRFRSIHLPSFSPSSQSQSLHTSSSSILRHSGSSLNSNQITPSSHHYRYNRALSIVSPRLIQTRTLASVMSSSLSQPLAPLPPITSGNLGIDVPSLTPVPPIPVANGPVNLKLPPTEDRPHRYFTLPNGLECIVVSDPKADKAAASMDVGVGHLSDPVNLPGCAHFCEHLMFLGTRKYPKENEYQSFLSSHNGHSNAWTAMTSTNYYFDVGPDALEGALDRFSRFFTEPLFTEDCTEREINAVNSENKKNLQNDVWRFFQLEKHLSKPGHVYRKFGTGNLKTLWEDPKSENRDPRAELIEWWRREYCAKRMKLAVAGRQDLDTLEKWVREMFEAVPVRTEGRPPTGPDGVRIAFEEHPYPVESRGMVTFVKPVRDARGLEISFPFPDVDHFYQTKPSTFAAHHLGHEGKGSILSYLKRRGWANSLRAGASDDATGFATMKVNIELTPDGLEHWEDVALVVFKYCALLRAQPPSTRAFEEMKRMSDISFRFAERGRTSDYATLLAGWMQSATPRDEIVSSKYLLGDFDGAVLSDIFKLLDPRLASIGVTCKELPKGVEGTFDLTEPIYGTEYTRRKLSDKFMQEATAGQAIKELQLPGPNLFIPERLDVTKVEVEKPINRPTLMRDTPISRLWYKKDDQFWMPKANIYAQLRSPLLEVTPRAAVLGRLLCDLFNDSTNEDIYDAELAELSFNLWYGGHSIVLAVGGFSDKIEVLTETMLGKLVAFKVDETRFGKIAEQAKQYWKNFELEEPYRVAPYWSSYTTASPVWTQKEKLQELQHITAADVQAYAKELFQRLHIETLVHGNTSAEGAKGIQDMIERVLSPRPLSSAERLGERALILPASSEHVWEIPVANPAEPNGAVVYYTQIGESTNQQLRAQLALLEQIASEPAFNILRTKEQLGYVVFATSILQSGLMGYRVIVQSERTPVYVETRIEQFFDSLKEILEKMDDEEFERHRQTLIDKREEKPKNLGQETRRYWSRITDCFYEFNKRENDIIHLKATTKQQVLDLFLSAVHPSSTTRSKLSVHLKPANSSASSGTTIKFDPSSAQQLVDSFTKYNISVDPVALGQLMKSSPELEAVKKFARDAVKSHLESESGASLKDDIEGRKEIEEMIEGLKGKQVGGEEESQAKVREGNIWIKDINEFKAGLVLTKAPFPVEPLESLEAVAKL